MTVTTLTTSVFFVAMMRRRCDRRSCRAGYASLLQRNTTSFLQFRRPPVAAPFFDRLLVLLLVSHEHTQKEGKIGGWANHCWPACPSLSAPREKKGRCNRTTGAIEQKKGKPPPLVARPGQPSSSAPFAITNSKINTKAPPRPSAD